MHGVSSKIGYALLVLLCFLMFPVQQLDAQPLWGEEGIAPVWFHITGNLNPDIVRYENGNHGVIVAVDELVPGPESSRFVELVFDANGELVDSVRYPAEMLDMSVANVIGLDDGSRIICAEQRWMGFPKVVKQNSDGSTAWVRDINVVSRAGQMYLCGDYILVLVKGSVDYELSAFWLSAESGGVFDIAHLTNGPTGKYTVREYDGTDSVRIALESGNWVHGYTELLLQVGSNNYTFLPVSDVDCLSSQSIYNSYYLMRIHNATVNRNLVYEIYDQSHDLLDSAAFPGESYCVNQFVMNGRVIGINDDAIVALEFEEGTLDTIWINNFENTDYCYQDDDGGAILVSNINHQIRRVSPNGTTQWTVNQDWSHYGDLLQVGPLVLCAYSGATQYRVNASTGALMEVDTLLNLDLGHLHDWRLVASGQEHSWLAFEEENLDVYPPEYRPTVRRLNANGSFDPEDDYFGEYLIDDSSFLTAAPAGGLWILTRNGQARLDRNADPVFEARETPFAFNRILYFNPSQDTAPYNILYRCAQSPSVHTVNLAFLNEDGNAASDPERLFGMPVSTSFLDYVMFTDAAHFHDDLLVYGLHAGRPMTGSLLGVYDTFRDENTVLDSLRDGVTLDVHTDGENYYDVLYRMTSDPDTIHPVSGELIVCYTPLSTPEITEVVLVDTIRGRYFGSEDDGMLKSCDARAFFTDKLLYTLTLDSGLTWNVRQYTYEGEVLNGPINLPVEASDDVAAFLEAEPEGCWVVLGQKVYLLDNDLEFIEAYEQGIPFTTWENIEYENPHAVQLANRNLVVAGNAGNSLLMAQCFEGLESGGGVDGDTKSIHPMTFELAAPWPNPFNSTTRLRYSLPHAGEVRLAVYDILGQLVRELANGPQQAGQYEVHWDGCSNAGIGVASGVYFVRAELGEQQLVRKMLLVK